MYFVIHLYYTIRSSAGKVKKRKNEKKHKRKHKKYTWNNSVVFSYKLSKSQNKIIATFNQVVFLLPPIISIQPQPVRLAKVTLSWYGTIISRISYSGLKRLNYLNLGCGGGIANLSKSRFSVDEGALRN